MKTMITYLFMLTLCFYILGCAKSRNVQQSESFPITFSIIGDYQYAGYDKNRVKIIEGRLSITSVESGKIKGTWQFHKIGNPERIGPQVGSDNFEGAINQNRISINLNPGWYDSNVILDGKFEGRNFSGTWRFDGFTGELNRGLFEARM